MCFFGAQSRVNSRIIEADMHLRDSQSSLLNEIGSSGNCLSLIKVKLYLAFTVQI